MLDPILIRHELAATAARLLTKGFELDVVQIQSLESQRKDLQVETEELQATRNSQSKAIGQAKSKGEDIQPLLDAVANLGDQLDSKKQALEAVQSRLNELLMAIPNDLPLRMDLTKLGPAVRNAAGESKPKLGPRITFHSK